jgi:hypothetical protein
MLFHGPACAQITGCNTRHAHDEVVHCIRGIAETFGFRAVPEPSLFAGQAHDDIRPDLRIHAPWLLETADAPPALVDSVALDVTVVHALCPSLRAQGLDQLAQGRNKAKVTKYSQICCATEYKGRAKDPEAFVPCALFPTGALTPPARQFCRDLSDLTGGNLAPGEIATMVSAAVSRGVGDVLSHLSATLSRRSLAT